MERRTLLPLARDVLDLVLGTCADAARERRVPRLDLPSLWRVANTVVHELGPIYTVNYEVDS